MTDPTMGRLARRQAAGSADLRAGRDDRRQRARAAHRAAPGRAQRPRPEPFEPHFWLSAEWFSPDGVPGVADPVLSRAPAPREARADADARGRRGHARVVHEDPAPRGRARDRQRLPSAQRGCAGSRCSARPTCSIPTTTRPSRTARATSSISTAGTRRAIPDEDFAETFAVWLTPDVRLADALRGLAGAQEAGVHGHADDASWSASRCWSPRRRKVEPMQTLQQDPARALRAQAPALRRSLHPHFYDRDLRQAVLGRARVHAAI